MRKGVNTNISVCDSTIDIMISQHYDNLQQAADNQKQPLKDTTNTSIQAAKQKNLNNNEEDRANQEPESTQEAKPEGSSGGGGTQTQEGSRSLQCLETLAQKAGIYDITAEDCKYDIAHTLLNLERGHDTVKHQDLKQEVYSGSMADINKGQQMVEAQAQQQQAQQQQQQQQPQQQQQQQVVQQQVVQQQQMQQVTMTQADQQQALVPAQSPQHIQQIAVASSGGQCVQTSMGPPHYTVSMHQQVAAQGGQVIQTQGGQLLATGSNNTTITTMSPLQQAQAAHTQQMDWSHGRVQVIQQPLQNQAYLQQLYNAQGPLLMPGNISLHPSINPQQIQVITKPFQGNQLGQHMITQGKQVLQASQGATFPGYTTIPTTQNQQTLVFSQLAIGSQPNIIPTHSAPGNSAVAQQKPQEMHKVMQGQKVQMQKVTGNVQTVAGAQQQQGQCVQVSQAMIGSQPTAQIISPLQNGQPMQFTPWQFTNGIPQVWTTNGLQSQALIAPNPIFIRGTQADGSQGMFIQQSPQAATIQTQQNQPTITAQGTIQQLGKPRPANENIQPKQATSRPLNILPSSTQNIRPASSVSTQTIGAQTQVMGAKTGAKVRPKAPGIRTSPAPKADAANQTQIKPYNNMQQHQIVQNKMLVMNTSTGISMTPGSPMTVEKAQQIANQNKQVQQGQQQQQQQQVMMQSSIQQQNALQQMQFQAQAGQQHIQPKPMMTMQTIQGIPHQSMQMQGDRPIMPVVSMSAQGQNGQVQQAMQQTIQGLSLQSNLAVTQQPMQMGIQQIHPQLQQMTQQGTIIGQIQAAQGTMSQVNTSNNQMQALTQGNQQTITLTTAQQVPLPANIPSVKSELVGESGIAADSPSGIVEIPKENGEIKELQSMEVKPIINGVEQNPTATVQPTPIPGTMTSVPVTTTTENGLPLAVTAEEVKERCPPKAMVKPQVLTHVIEDFVIQESSEPFPITRSSLLGDYKHPNSDKEHPDEPPRKKLAASPNNVMSMSPKGELAKCESCGIVDIRAKFKKNKRFCSISCSKSQKIKDGKKKWDKDEQMEVDVESNSGAESSLSPTESSQVEDTTPKVDPLKWTVQEVCDFIKNLPGCSDYAEDFLIQEIDGQALMLLKEDHLMTAMAMKLGPALKIVAKIDDMRVDKEPPPKQN
ncbi:PREDICTED: polyhomeotic-proximal chromatin protein-like isoform X3 [Nicrophorus vespilloides]|uniref:Polyhomeotic-proximal chromatin protein-like isoform X3 n=1 Tax=Nicrophorus vespilloides TaxID=110193 RepID=A0ABM1MIE1_NICVS|nr:PREDICTED: polyhomeotic-proximal chromatin protein-like isoform X3 [Nicrophorus vespilloides]